MLSLKEKIKTFENYLLIEDDSYLGNMKEEIYQYFFVLYESEDNSSSFQFLDEKNTTQDIQELIDFIASKMIMHEHEDGLEKIIEDCTIEL